MEENCQKCCFSRTFGIYGGDLGGVLGSAKSFPGNLTLNNRPGSGGWVTKGSLGIPKFSYPVFEKKIEFYKPTLSQEPIKLPEPINLKSTRVIPKVSQSISCAQQQMQSWSRTDLAHRVKEPGSQKTRTTFMGIILGCCKESQFMFPDTPFLIKKVETYK